MYVWGELWQARVGVPWCEAVLVWWIGVFFGVGCAEVWWCILSVVEWGVMRCGVEGGAGCWGCVGRCAVVLGVVGCGCVEWGVVLFGRGVVGWGEVYWGGFRCVGVVWCGGVLCSVV